MTPRIAVLIALSVMAGVTSVVIAVIRRAPSIATRRATMPDVLFLVTARRWQYLLIRGVGIGAIVLGVLLGLIGIGGADPGPVFGGTGIALALGLPFLWLAHWLNRSHLEVTADSVWVFKGVSKQERVPLTRITRLTALSGNYGGVVARAGTKKLFQASRTMLGYPALIDYLIARRPDLIIPDRSWPLQDEANVTKPRHSLDEQS